MQVMRKSSLIFILLCLVCSPTWAQPPKDQSVDFSAPPGWRTETIALPPDFAPTMSWSGVEVLKFSPDMFKPEARDFFSYVFLLKLDSGEPNWETELMKYYRGLAKAVMEDPELDDSEFRLELSGKGSSRYGKLWWTEPFKTKSKQVLNLEIAEIGNRTWFICVSPTSPRSPIWTSMRSMRNSLY